MGFLDRLRGRQEPDDLLERVLLVPTPDAGDESHGERVLEEDEELADGDRLEHEDALVRSHVEVDALEPDEHDFERRSAHFSDVTHRLAAHALPLDLG